jgi:hypothetical protein
MENPKKYSNEQKPSFVKEPETIYETKQEITQQKNTPEQEVLLQKLLKLGCEQIDRGETTPHDVVMERIKKKYNFEF